MHGIDGKFADSDVLSLLGLAGNDPLTATQRGEGNSATLKLVGTGGELQLFQSSLPGGVWAPGRAAGDNLATVTAADYALGGIVQIGELNRAGLTLGANARGLISQLGSRLDATLDVAPGGNGTINQIGTNSTTGTITVGTGTTLTYTQIGDNLTPSSAASVYSTLPGNISITQTSW